MASGLQNQKYRELIKLKISDPHHGKEPNVQILQSFRQEHRQGYPKLQGIWREGKS